MPPKHVCSAPSHPSPPLCKHTKADIYTVASTATPHERLSAFLYNRINTPRFLASLAIAMSKSGKKRRPPPFASAANLPPNTRPIIRTRSDRAIVLDGELDYLISEDRIERSLLACGVQDIELEQEILDDLEGVKDNKIPVKLSKEKVTIKRVSLNVVIYKEEPPDGTLKWSIHAWVQANNFGMRTIRLKGVKIEDSQLQQNLLRAELFVVMRSDKDRKLSVGELKALETLLSWEVVVELLKNEARVLSNRKARTQDALIHMGIKGDGFLMKKIDESTVNEDEMNEDEAGEKEKSEEEINDDEMNEEESIYSCERMSLGSLGSSESNNNKEDHDAEKQDPEEAETDPEFEDEDEDEDGDGDSDQQGGQPTVAPPAPQPSGFTRIYINPREIAKTILRAVNRNEYNFKDQIPSRYPAHIDNGRRMTVDELTKEIKDNFSSASVERRKVAKWAKAYPH